MTLSQIDKSDGAHEYFVRRQEEGRESGTKHRGITGIANKDHGIRDSSVISYSARISYSVRLIGAMKQ